jgi:hypothetical protein
MRIKDGIDVTRLIQNLGTWASDIAQAINYDDRSRWYANKLNEIESHLRTTVDSPELLRAYAPTGTGTFSANPCRQLPLTAPHRWRDASQDPAHRLHVGARDAPGR